MDNTPGPGAAMEGSDQNNQIKQLEKRVSKLEADIKSLIRALHYDKIYR